MREQTGVDLWRFHAAGEWVAVTTNLTVRRDGCAVMGRGTARDAAKKFPDLQTVLGTLIGTRYERTVWVFPDWRLVAFSVKRHWRDPALASVIVTSATQLSELLTLHAIDQIYLPRPGCGNGNLTWKYVRPLIAPLLDDRVVVITNEMQ